MMCYFVRQIQFFIILTFILLLIQFNNCLLMMMENGIFELTILLYVVCCMLYVVRSKVYAVRSKVYVVRSKVYVVRSRVYVVGCTFVRMYFTLTVSMFHTHIPYGVGTLRLRLVQHLKQDSCASLTRFTHSSHPSIHSPSDLFYLNEFIHEFVCSFVRSFTSLIPCNALHCIAILYINILNIQQPIVFHSLHRIYPKRMNFIMPWIIGFLFPFWILPWIKNSSFKMSFYFGFRVSVFSILFHVT